MNDPICTYCRNRATKVSFFVNGVRVEKKISCQNPCAPLTWINGRVPRKEPLLEDPREIYSQPDYNETLHNIIRAKQSDHITEIREIKDNKIRAIASMLYANMSVNQISRLLKCHRKTVYRWLNIKDL